MTTTSLFKHALDELYFRPRAWVQCWVLRNRAEWLTNVIEELDQIVNTINEERMKRVQQRAQTRKELAILTQFWRF